MPFGFLKKKKEQALIDCPHCFKEMRIPEEYDKSFPCEFCQKEIIPIFDPNRELFEDEKIPSFYENERREMIFSKTGVSGIIAIIISYILDYFLSEIPYFYKTEYRIYILFPIIFIIIQTLIRRCMRF